MMLEKRLTYFYMVLLWIMLLFNCFFSFFKTTFFELYMKNELPSYKNDNIVLLAISLVLLGLICLGVDSLLGRMKNGSWLCVVSCLWAGGISLFFVLLFHCQVVCDSAFVSQYAVEFMQGNYEVFEKGGYLNFYPFQLGLIAVLELIYRIFGIENYLAFQIINVISIVAIVYMLHGITKELFDDTRVVWWEQLLSMAMLPLFLYASFVYGDVIGFALGVAAIYCGILYLNREKWQYLLLAGAAFMVAVIVKSNTLVLLAAFCIALMLKMIQNKKWLLILWMAGIIVFSQAGVWIVDYSYEKRAGVDEIYEGTPKAAWIAMGLQDAVETDNGCGWYNGYNMNVYRESGFDTQLAKEKSIESIKESLGGFVKNPKYAVYYFYKKFVSQWNDPTFQSLMVSEWYSRYVGRSALADYFIYGAGRWILSQIMNIYHLFFFICAMAGCFAVMKNWSLPRAYLLLNVFGGFLFHMIWEAKSRYILPYFVLLLPIAAFGLCRLFTLIKKRNHLIHF